MSLIARAVRKRLLAALFAAAAGLAASGCSQLGLGWPYGNAPARSIRVTFGPQLAPAQRRERLFCAQFLHDLPTTTRLVAILCEPLKGELALLLDPKRYVSGDVGAYTLGRISRDFPRLRLVSIHADSGRHLGYGLIPPGKTLHVLEFAQGRFTLELQER